MTNHIYCGHTFAGSNCQGNCPHIAGHCEHCQAVAA